MELVKLIANLTLPGEQEETQESFCDDAHVTLKQLIDYARVVTESGELALAMAAP